MIKNRQKKLDELKHLEKALMLQGEKYSIIDEDGESPDFLIEINGESIGIEVTKIYRDLDDGNSAKTQSDIRFITDESVKIYNDKGGIPLGFGFAYNGKVAVRSGKIIAQELGAYIYYYVNKEFPQGTNEIKKINIDQGNHELSSFVSTVFAGPTDSKTAVGFAVSTFDSVPTVDSMIEEAVRKKETLLPKYLERCKKVWLLIVLPAMDLAGDLRLQKESIKLNYDFDAVYILDDYRNQVIKINNN